MADIELVIKIPEEEYRNICLMSKDGIGMALYDWIANGIALSKGHGRLIDADVLMKELIANEWITNDDGGGLEDILHNSSTIIEADRAESEG